MRQGATSKGKAIPSAQDIQDVSACADADDPLVADDRHVPTVCLREDPVNGIQRIVGADGHAVVDQFTERS
jgi:hypothetical protein